MSIKKLLISLILCFFVAYAGSVVTLPAITTWYTTLHKPFFNPPNYVFGPVWSLLYLMIALALAKVWSMKKKTTRALQVFALQLGLNLLWSFVFFGMHLLLGGLMVIIFLWIVIYKTVIAFLPLSKPAAYLLIPYLLWVSYAAILNLAIVVLNF